MSNFLPDLVGRMKVFEEMQKEAEQSGESLSDEVYFEKEIINSLIAGKVDQAAELRLAVQSRIEGLKKCLAKTQELEERIEEAFIAATRMTDSKRLEGLIWQAKMQPNGSGAVVVENQTELPDKFKFTDVTITSRFPVTDEKTKRFYTSVILKKAIPAGQVLSEADQKMVDECFSLHISKTAIGAELKKDPNSVPGAKLVKGEHLKITQGFGKPTKKEKLPPKQTPELLPADTQGGVHGSV